MKYTAIVTGQINGEALRLMGAGELDLVSGAVVGGYDIEQIAPGIDSLIFNAVLVTGYPSACKSRDNAYNPFHSGSYSYIRRIEFEGGGQISYQANCISEESGLVLKSVFEVDAMVPKMRLDSCLPLVETWAPQQTRGIFGSFSIVWKRRDGAYLIGVAKTDYEPPAASPPLSNVHERRIVLTNERPSPRTLLIKQESELWPI
jgi:hypothetical protein